MAYGYPTADSRVRLDHATLKQAIIAKGNRGRKGQVQCSYHVWAHLNPDDTIDLRLYKTNIVTFHPNGNRVLRSGMWNTPLTKHWFGEARIDIVSQRPNEWTDQQWYYRRPDYVHPYNNTMLYRFYDGLTIDDEGKVLSEVLPITKHVPNKEAKDLRKQMLKVYNTDYLPHLRMLGTCDNWAQTIAEWKTTGLDRNNFDRLITLGMDPLPLIAWHLGRVSRNYRFRWGSQDPVKLFRHFIDNEYKRCVRCMDMLAVVPYDPTK